MYTVLQHFITNTQWMGSKVIRWSGLTLLTTSQSKHHRLNTAPSQLLGHNRFDLQRIGIRGHDRGVRHTTLLDTIILSPIHKPYYAVILTRQRRYIEPRQWSDLLRGYQIEDIRVEHVCDYHQGLTASCFHQLAPSSFSSNNLVCQIIPHYPYIISSFLTECICVL